MRTEPHTEHGATHLPWKASRWQLPLLIQPHLPRLHTPQARLFHIYNYAHTFSYTASTSLPFSLTNASFPPLGTSQIHPSSWSSLSLYFTNPCKHSYPSHVIINLGLLAFHSCISCSSNTVINSRGSSFKPLRTSKSGSQPVVYQEPWISVPSNFKQFIEFIFIHEGATLL